LLVVLLGFAADGYYVLLPIAVLRREIMGGHWDINKE